MTSTPIPTKPDSQLKSFKELINIKAPPEELLLTLYRRLKSKRAKSYEEADKIYDHLLKKYRFSSILEEDNQYKNPPDSLPSNPSKERNSPEMQLLIDQQIQKLPHPLETKNNELQLQIDLLTEENKSLKHELHSSDHHFGLSASGAQNHLKTDLLSHLTSPDASPTTTQNQDSNPTTNHSNLSEAQQANFDQLLDQKIQTLLFPLETENDAQQLLIDRLTREKALLSQDLDYCKQLLSEESQDLLAENLHLRKKIQDLELLLNAANASYDIKQDNEDFLNKSLSNYKEMVTTLNNNSKTQQETINNLLLEKSLIQEENSLNHQPFSSSAHISENSQDFSRVLAFLSEIDTCIRIGENTKLATKDFKDCVIILYDALHEEELEKLDNIELNLQNIISGLNNTLSSLRSKILENSALLTTSLLSTIKDSIQSFLTTGPISTQNAHPSTSHLLQPKSSSDNATSSSPQREPKLPTGSSSSSSQEFLLRFNLKPSATTKTSLQHTLQEECLKQQIFPAASHVHSTSEKHLTLRVSPQDREKINTLVESSETLKDSISVLHPDLPTSQLLLLNVEDNLSKQDLKLSILSSYPELSQDLSLEKNFPSNTKNKLHWVLKLPTALAKNLLLQKYLYFLFTKYKIVKYLSILRCTTCQVLNQHPKSRCPSANHPICVFCSGDHPSDSCPRDSLSCINCKREGLRDSNHKASSSQCPLYKRIRKMQLKNLYTSMNTQPSIDYSTGPFYEPYTSLLSSGNNTHQNSNFYTFSRHPRSTYSWSRPR